MTRTSGRKAILATAAVLGGGLLITLFDSVGPMLFGTAPILASPPWLLAIANLLTLAILAAACFGAFVGGLAWFMDTGEVDYDLTGLTGLLPLRDYLTRYGAEDTMAPKLALTERLTVMETLHSIQMESGQVLVGLVGENGASDRVILFTSAGAAAVRDWAKRMSADLVSRLAKDDSANIKARFPAAKGTGWVIVWE
jgi:hypothetical protein